MIGENNWCMVKCSTPGCTSPEWLMHWPCQGSEDDIRNGQHFCGECWAKAFEATCNADPVRHYPVTLPETVFQDDEDEIGNIQNDLRKIARESKEN